MTNSRPPRPTVPEPAATMSVHRAPSVWNIANYLTILRILLVPVFGFFLLREEGDNAAYRWAAFATFAIAMITDRIDGDLARSRGLVTDFGKVIDPIADKALVTMALVGLSSLDLIPWWITIVILVREWGITAMRFWVIRHGVLAAGRGGKLKTMLQALALGWFVIPRDTLPFEPAWNLLAWGLLVLALVVTVVTGIDYIVQALRLRQTSSRALAKRALREARRMRKPPTS